MTFWIWCMRYVVICLFLFPCHVVSYQIYGNSTVVSIVPCWYMYCCLTSSYLDIVCRPIKVQHMNMIFLSDIACSQQSFGWIHFTSGPLNYSLGRHCKPSATYEDELDLLILGLIVCSPFKVQRMKMNLIFLSELFVAHSKCNVWRWTWSSCRHSDQTVSWWR